MKTLRIVSLLVFVFCWIQISFGQSPDTLWTRTYGGNDFEFGTDVLLSKDGGYIICGNTKSYGVGDLDVYMLKINDSGKTLWTQTYGGVWGEVGWSLNESGDGGYAIAGETWSYGAGQNDMLLIKTDASGNMEWMKTYGSNGNEWCRTMLNTKDGGYMLVGSTKPDGAQYSDIYLVKTDASGDTVWTKTYGGEGDEIGNWIQETSDNGYIICGSTNSYGFGANDIYVIKTNIMGDTIWTKTYGGEDHDIGNCIQVTKDDGCIVLGITNSLGNGASDVYLLELNSSGDTIWTQVYGGTENDEPISVKETEDQGYIIVGLTESFGAGSGDVWLIRTDSAGDTLWTQTYGGTEFDEAPSIQLTRDGGYILVGTTESFGAGSGDVWLIKTTSDLSGIIEDHITEIPVDFVLNQNYPNPFNPSTKITFTLPKTETIKLQVYNTLGQMVGNLVEDKLQAGSHAVEFNTSHLPSGVYFYRLQAGEWVDVKKMIVLK